MLIELQHANSMTAVRAKIRTVCSSDRVQCHATVAFLAHQWPFSNCLSRTRQPLNSLSLAYQELSGGYFARIDPVCYFLDLNCKLLDSTQHSNTSHHVRGSRWSPRGPNIFLITRSVLILVIFRVERNSPPSENTTVRLKRSFTFLGLFFA